MTLRSTVVFLAGLVAGAGIESVLAQQEGIAGLNHVAVSVADYTTATSFYAKQMGFREAFSFRDANGAPYFTYFQINRDTFLEVMQATPERPAGCPHFGLEVQNLDSVVEHLRRRGVEVRPPSVSPRTGTRIALAIGPGGVNMELLEMGPGSLHRKAIESWK
ncbi:MAG: VOC family protein [Acidobacteria bacterium]|nr:MAG: VOC family protein [Acidobacteriota bacterium]